MVNVKTGAAMLGKSQSWLVARARRIGIQKTKAQYYFSTDDLKAIQDLNRIARLSNLRDISAKTRMSHHRVRSLADRLGLRFRTDKDKIIEACELKKTGFYTTKGIKHILGL